MKIVVPDDFPPVYEGHSELDALAPYGEVSVHGKRAADQGELAERLIDAGAVINVRAYSRFDEALFSSLPELRALAILGTGTDNVDLQAATRHGVVVSNTPGASTVSVAEHTIALMFAAARAIPASDRSMRSGHWRHLQGMELRGKTLGLVGLGAIGMEVAALGKALGMEVMAWSLTRDEARAARAGIQLLELDDLLRLSDVVSLHLRASDRTAGIIGAQALSLMKPSAILVNTGRGALVDEDALATALASGKLRAAALDVFVQEPLPADSPLAGLENMVLSPHTAWVTVDASARLRRMPVENLIAFFQGRPTNVVNSDVLGR